MLLCTDIYSDIYTQDDSNGLGSHLIMLESHCADFNPGVPRIVNPWPSMENCVESQQHRGHTLAIRDHSLVILDESWQFGKFPGGFKMFKTTVVNQEIISICDKP